MGCARLRRGAGRRLRGAGRAAVGPRDPRGPRGAAARRRLHGRRARRPAHEVRGMFDAAGVRVLLGDDDRIRTLGAIGHGSPRCGAGSRGGGGERPADAPAAGADPERVAYVAVFASGSTGTPKGANPHRGVIRLALNRVPAAGRLGPDRTAGAARLRRLHLEIFAPLLNGGTVEVFAEPYLTPDGLAEFLRERRSPACGSRRGCSGWWPTTVPTRSGGCGRSSRAGTWCRPHRWPGCSARARRAGQQRLRADGEHDVHHRPSCRHGGRRRRSAADRPSHPGHGRPGARPEGRPVPPGGVGSCTPPATASPSGTRADPRRPRGRSAASARRWSIRSTGPATWSAGTAAAGCASWAGGTGRSRSGASASSSTPWRACSASAPGVRDAAVVPTASADRRLLAGVVAREEPGLLDAVRAFAAERLPGYALPSLWAVVAELRSPGTESWTRPGARTGPR